MKRYLCLFCIIFSLVLCSAAYAKKKKVLVVESYHTGFEWDNNYLSAIKSSLGDGFEVINFELDTKRIPKARFKDQADKAFNEFIKQSPDVVVLGDDNANSLLARRIIPYNIPMVYLGINNNPRAHGLYGHKHVTGVLERPLFKRSVHFMKRILPDGYQKVLFLFDKSVTSNLLYERAFSSSTTMMLQGVQAELKQVDNYDEWKQVIQNSQKEGYGAVFLGLYQALRSNGKTVPDDAVIRWTSKNSPIPCFGLWKFSVGKGRAVGGLVHLGEQQGRTAAMLIKRLIEGRNTTSMPEVAEQGVLLFSESELARWGFTVPHSLANRAMFVE